MNVYLNAETLAWQRKVRDFVQQVLVPLSEQVEREGSIPGPALQEMRRMGLFGTHTPREYGGLGLNMLCSCIAIEELAAASIAFYYTCGVNVHIGSKAIEMAGTHEQKQRYLRPLATGEFIGALAMTEPQAGSDAARIGTTATLTGDKYILNGRKIFITNAQIADCFTVIARSDSGSGSAGLSAFIVPRDSEGLVIGRQIDMLAGNGSFHNEVIFDDCIIDRQNLLGEPGQGFRLAMMCLDHGRTHWAAYCSGLGRTLLQHAIHRISTREQFGGPLVDKQGVQWTLAELATIVQHAQLIAYDCAWRFDNDPKNRTLHAAMAKLANAETVFQVANRVLQLFGGYGYSKDYPIERMWREARVVGILDGTSEMMKQIVARETLKGLDDFFS
ncbi:MAG: acyl-CoA dehydrogenase family protein [Pusillimonas sp.]